MAQLYPYIHFNGNAEEAFLFYQKALQGEITNLVRFKDFASPENPVSAEEENKIMHISLSIGKDGILLGSDTPDSLGKHNENETRSKMYFVPDSKEAALEIFTALSDGGQVEMPLEESPWGTYFAMFRDKFGIE